MRREVEWCNPASPSRRKRAISGSYRSKDSIRRREFLAGGLASAAGMSRAAAQPAASRRLAIFSLFEPAALMIEKSENRYYRALFAELRRLGHVERKPRR